MNAKTCFLYKNELGWVIDGFLFRNLRLGWSYTTHRWFLAKTNFNDQIIKHRTN